MRGEDIYIAAHTLQRMGQKIHRGSRTFTALISAPEHQGLKESDFSTGDVALIRTGRGDQWMVDNNSYYDGEPGLGLDTTQWLIDRGALLIAADNWAVEVLPSLNPDPSYPVHQLSLTKHGVYLFENIKLDELAEDGMYKTAFFFSLFQSATNQRRDRFTG